MMLLIDNGGQTCNQLWAYASAYNYGIENGERICILAYDKDIVYFPNLLKSKHFVFPFYSELFHKILGIDTYVKIIRRFLRGKHHNLYPLITWLLGGKCIKPWDDLYALSPQSNCPQIHYIFNPSKNVVEDVDKQFLTEVQRCDIIIGIHIRRGDYRLWQCGHYFFEMKEYHDICARIKDLYPEKRVKFFISTNDSIEPKDWEGLDYFVIENSSAIKDLYCLSKCDYIVGPPSSFSRWAAFIGSKKLCFIHDKNQQQFQFKRVASYGYFEDGSPIWYNLYFEDAPSLGMPNHPKLKKIKNED